MSRVLFFVCLSLALTACSVGHVSLPMTPSNPPTAIRSTKTGLGGPRLATPGPVQPHAGRAGDDASGALANPSALDLINELRFTKGLAPLTVSPQLTRAAQMQVVNLARSGTLSHIGPDGSTPLDRVRQAGYKPRVAAENVAGGQDSVMEALRSWRESDSHLRNLLLADATQMGIAELRDPRSPMRTYWALVLAAPR